MVKVKTSKRSPGKTAASPTRSLVKVRQDSGVEEEAVSQGREKVN